MSESKEKHDLEAMRHSCAHVLAQAVLNMFPEAKLGIGPAIKDGFYYDFELPRTLIPEDLALLEKGMMKILNQKQKFQLKAEPVEESLRFLKETDQVYKLELAKGFADDGQEITFYENVMPEDGKPMFVDLCRGGHVEHTGQIGAFKLTKIAGAYWKGKEDNPMLQRIYGTCWPTKEELKAYMDRIEQAKKRDHKVLGKQLGLFTSSELVGAGYPMLLPKGAKLKHVLEKYITDLKEEKGYKFVCIPHVAKEDLYIRSGHMGKYDAMMPVMETEEGDRIVMKAMNCPHHFELYNAEMHSYRELPLRYAENTMVYRNEKSGEVNGLFRVRCITQDDTHHFVRHEQIGDEITMILGLTKQIYDRFGFEKLKARISVRDPENPQKYFGDDKLWDKAEAKLIEAVQKWSGNEYFIGEGEAAFYGPKIDVMVEDALGREWQLATVQLDFTQPENFEMTYIAEDGTQQRPAVLHVAILGSFERFMGIIIEHYGGAFPAWLAPVQAKILAVSEQFDDYATKVYDELKAAGARVEIDYSNDNLGKKIRNAELQKVPYMIVVGEKEREAGNLAVRSYETKEQTAMGMEEFLKLLGS